MSSRPRKIRLVPIDLESFEKHKKLRIHPKFVLVAFGDTIKFREWEDLYLISSWESWKFIERLYREFARIRNGSVYVKPLADGFMAVKELANDSKTRTSQVGEFLRHSYRVSQSINKLISKLPFPRPQGFRIRVVAGYVGRLEVFQPRARFRKVDYTGKPISLAFSLLAVKPQNPCVCCQNVKAIIDGNKGSCGDLMFESFTKQNREVRKGNLRNKNMLWSFRVSTLEPNQKAS